MYIAGNVAVIDSSGDEPVPVICAYAVVRGVSWSRDDGVVGTVQHYVDATDFENKGYNGPVATSNPAIGHQTSPTLSGDLASWFVDQMILGSAGGGIWENCTRES